MVAVGARGEERGNGKSTVRLTSGQYLSALKARLNSKKRQEMERPFGTAGLWRPFIPSMACSLRLLFPVLHMTARLCVISCL